MHRAVEDVYVSDTNFITGLIDEDRMGYKRK